MRKAALGKTVLNRVESARRHGRSARPGAEGADLWARFCVEEAGVQVNHYQPEKRLVILAGKTGIQCHDARQPLLGWQPLPASSRRALGKALINRIIMHEPSVHAPQPADSPTPDQPG